MFRNLLLVPIFLFPLLSFGEISYTLVAGHEEWPENKRAAISKAMDEAVAIYNEHTSLSKALTVNYNPKVGTANANAAGRITFGRTISTRVALHEISHTVGIGTWREWRKLKVDGKWTGPLANAQVKKFEGEEAVLNCGRIHFWPYGLNFDKETRKLGPEETYRRHTLMVEAIVADMRNSAQADAAKQEKQ